MLLCIHVKPSFLEHGTLFFSTGQFLLVAGLGRWYAEGGFGSGFRLLAVLSIGRALVVG
jgi:hypothetical protein